VAEATGLNGEMTMEKGILYVATGARYVEEARSSARSVRACNPSLPICLVTDQPIEPDADFDIVRDVHETPSGTAAGPENYLALDRVAYYRKILPLVRSPFEKTLFLDTDTWVGDSLEDLFTLLDRFDLLVTPAHIVRDYDFEKEELPFNQIPDAFGYFNTGLIAYRRGPNLETFMRRWVENYSEHTARFTVNDQPAFRLTLFEGPASFHVLPPNYNILSWAPFIVPAGGRIVMLHGRNPWLRKWAGLFKGGARPLITGTWHWRAGLAYQAARLLNAGLSRWHRFRGGK